MSFLRCSIASVAVLLGMGGHAQSCIQISIQGEGPARGEVVHCANGSIPAIVDGFGRFCPRDPCDTLVFGGGELAPVRLAWSQVVSTGQVTLTRVPKVLAPLEITPWPGKKDRQALAAVSGVDSLSLGGPEQGSLRRALAGLPGVRMDERGEGGSARLSIRGSLLRSPYGTRGVKVYWGPFALTLADGTTPLELLDPLLVGDLDVVRSVGGPVYGSAPSGVLLADAPWRKTPGTTVSVDGMGGSYGLYKLSTRLEVRDPSGSALTIGATRMDNTGYREQEYSHRDQVFLASQWRHAHAVTRAYMTAQRATWALPGSIDSLTSVNDPRAARAYSNTIDAHLEKEQLFAGLAHEQHLVGPLLLRAAVQAQVISKLNPYGTTPGLSGYKDEHIRNGGTRVSIGGDHGSGRIRFAWEVGVEGLLEKDQLFEQDYKYAVLGSTRSDATTRVANLNGFLTTRTRFGERTTLFADIGTERTGFHLDDALHGTTLSTDRTATLHPLIGLEERLAHGFTAHVRYAGTTSRPTIWELLGSEGVFNPALAAEEVREAEAGLDIAGDDGRWAASLVGYMRNTDGLILQRTVNDGDATIYQNVGDAHQNGVEATCRGRLPLPKGHRLELLLNGAWQYHRLDLPERTSAIDVPGIPRWSGSGELRWRNPSGTGAAVEGLFSSSVGASSTLQDQVPGYTVFSLRVDHQWTRDWGGWGVFLRLDDLFDVHYTAFVQLDDPGRRYYNPAPGRTFRGGASFTFGRRAAERTGDAQHD